MKINQFYFLWMFLFFIFLSCATPSASSGESSDYYDNDNSTNVITNASSYSSVKNLIFLMSLKYNDQTNDNYLVTDQIKSIRIKLNNKNLGVYDSVKYDISEIEKTTKNNFYIRKEKYQYQVILKMVNTDLTGDTTAGDYAKIMNGALSTGDYIFEIDNLEFSSTLDTTLTKKINPHYLKYFSIKESADNFFVGDLELMINL